MASTYLSKAVSTTGNRRTWTFSAWVKRANVSTSAFNIITMRSGAEQEWISFDQNSIHVSRYSGSYIYRYITNRLFRDNSAWYHIVVRMDTTQATGSDRMRLYINGVQETSFSTETQVSQNADTTWNTSGYTNYIGNEGNNQNYFDGEMSHIHLCDGQSYAPTEFGETDSTTGIWKPKTAPSVTYGTNGFFLKFENSGAFGTDSSGNSNTFTVNGTMTQTIDTPSNVFATLNPLARRLTTNDPTYSNGNTSLQGQTVNGQNNNAIATLGDLAKGKYYFECKVGTVGSDFGVGISDTPDPSNGIPEGSYEVFYKYDGTKWTGSYTSYGATYTTGDIIGVAFDVTAGTIEFYKNGVSQGVASSDLATNLDNGYAPMGYTNRGLMNFNFGNGYFGTTAVSSAGTNAGIGTFEYDVPSGYKAVCTKNINAEEYS